MLDMQIEKEFNKERVIKICMVALPVTIDIQNKINRSKQYLHT